MTTTKYGHYIVREPLHQGKTTPKERRLYFNPKQVPGLGCHIEYNCQVGPLEMVKKPHVHAYNEMLFFISTNPLDFKDFDAEVEIYLGEEQEKHIIHSSSMVFIPQGTPHGPLYFKKMNKPIILMTIYATDAENLTAAAYPSS